MAEPRWVYKTSTTRIVLSAVLFVPALTRRKGSMRFPIAEPQSAERRARLVRCRANARSGWFSPLSLLTHRESVLLAGTGRQRRVVSVVAMEHRLRSRRYVVRRSPFTMVPKLLRRSFAAKLSRPSAYQGPTGGSFCQRVIGPVLHTALILVVISHLFLRPRGLFPSRVDFASPKMLSRGEDGVVGVNCMNLRRLANMSAPHHVRL